MNDKLKAYLWQTYRRDILGESSEVAPPEMTPEMVADAKAEIARIDGMRLGASLASRDFASFQNRRALAALLAEYENEH